MNVTGEFALLAAVVLPIAVLGAINLFLLATGERETLLLPLGAAKFPAALELAAPHVELQFPRSELVDTGKHPVLVIEEEWALRKAA